MSTKLAHQTQKTAGISNGMRTAVIASVSGSTVAITVSGGTFSEGVGVVGTYVPVVGDTVAVFRQDSSWLVLGPTGASLNGGTITGTEVISFTTLSTLTLAADFGVTFPTPPVVTTNINSQAGAVRVWLSAATLVTTTGFTFWVRSADLSTATWSNVAVDWTATAR